MVNLLIVLFLLILFPTTFLFQKLDEKQDKCLLIHYTEKTTCVVVKFYGLTKNRDKYFCNPFFDMGDDFSEYFPETKTFYYDGSNFKVSDSTKILFWDYDNKKEIVKLPFTYSKISIDSLVSDSNIIFSLNNIKQFLKIGEIYTDSIIEFKNEQSRLIKFKTIYTIENIGLLNKANILDNKAWDERQRLENEEREQREFRELNIK